MQNLTNNSGISKDLRVLISEFQEKGFNFDMHKGRIKVSHSEAGLIYTVSMRPNVRDLRNARSRMQGVLRGMQPHSGNAESQTVSVIQPVTDGGAATGYAGVDDVAVPDEDTTLGPCDDGNGPFESGGGREGREAEGLGAEQEGERMMDMTERDVSASQTVNDDEAVMDTDGGPAPISPLDRLAMIGDDEMDLIERVLRDGMPSGALVVTPDMIGATLIIHEGAIVTAPAILTRIAALSAGVTRQVAVHPFRTAGSEKIVRRADAVSRRMGQISASTNGSAEMIDGLMEVFSMFPRKDLRAREIYSALPEEVRKRYSSMRSCCSSFSKPLRQMIEDGLIVRGANIGREATWRSL